MAVCGGTNCNKRYQCKLYEGNAELNTVHEYIDWSNYGSGSFGVDENSTIHVKEQWSCGDRSNGYPMFQQRELNPKYDWIPCSIRNPKEYGKYLVTCEDTDIVQIRLFEGEWDSIKKVIAWKILPEKYKGDV